jgi:hypothetical protein
MQNYTEQLIEKLDNSSLNKLTKIEQLQMLKLYYIFCKNEPKLFKLLIFET